MKSETRSVSQSANAFAPQSSAVSEDSTTKAHSPHMPGSAGGDARSSASAHMPTCSATDNPGNTEPDNERAKRNDADGDGM